MYEHILLPLDGTPLAEQALAHAASIARRLDAHLHLALVRELSGLALAEPPPAEVFEAVESEHADYLGSVAERLRTAGVADVSSEVLKGPEIVLALEEHRERVGADLTIMASHGRGPAGRAWLGSVSDRFIRLSKSPVLLVHVWPDAPPPGDLGADVPLRRILVPVDGSTWSEAAVEPAMALGSPSGAEYTLVRLSEYPRALGSWWFPAATEKTEAQLEAARARGEAELDAARTRIRARGNEASVVFEFVDHVPAGILARAAEMQADLIAITTHGRGGLGRLALGSVADKVLRGAECPVLVVRPEWPAVGQNVQERAG